MSEQPNRYAFEGRRAVVTGGAQGMGLAVVELLQGGGAEVEIWDVVPCENSAAVFRRIDVSDWPAVAGGAEAAKRAGGIDILVCSAGINGPNVPTWEYPFDAWARIQRVNLDGVFHCCRAIVPMMMEGGYGRIVNIASVAGKEGNPNSSAYSASKAAMISLTKSLGKELADRNIAVNCITPSVANTAMLQRTSKEQLAYVLAKVPRGRFVTLQEIAALVGWLASADNSFTTGAVFDISGGRSTY
jgi:NAD(P)-dependent dehydrogenase (short-subunit alcohol dehydrogenase family)